MEYNRASQEYEPTDFYHLMLRGHIHQKEDHGKLLDIWKDPEYSQTQAAQAVIEGFYNAKGITDSKEIAKSPAYLEELKQERKEPSPTL